MIKPRGAAAIRLLLLPFLYAAVPVSSITGAETAILQPQPLVLNLDKAIALALARNRDVLIAGQERAKAVSQIDAERSGAYPQINISGQYMRNVEKPVMFLSPNTPLNPSSSTRTFELGSDNAYQLSASLSQAIFNRKDRSALKIARMYEDFSEAGFHATREDVSLAVKRAFYGVLLAKELMEANRQGLETVKANLESVQSLYRQGSVAEYDLLRAEVELANTEPFVTSAENSVAVAEDVLRGLLAVPSDQAVKLEGGLTFEELPAATMARAESVALSANPSMVQLSLQESMLEKKILLEKASRFPTLNLLAAYQWQTQDNTFSFQNYNWARVLSAGLQLSYPLFDGFRTRAHIHQAFIDREKIRYTRLKAEEGLGIRIRSAKLKMAEAKKRVEAQEKNTDQAAKAVRIAQTRFKNGVGTQLELLDAQVAMTRAQTNRSLSVFDYLIARAEWQHAVGLSE